VEHHQAGSWFAGQLPQVGVKFDQRCANKLNPPIGAWQHI
jgi:hypothetical protein